MKIVVFVLLATATAAHVHELAAQTYPTKPMRLIVPFAAGGPNDVIGRLIAQKVGEQMGQPMVIENRPGAGGAVGTAFVATAPADGYTLLISGTSSLAINPSLYKKLPYDPLGDFTPVSLVGTAPSLLVMHPSVPVKSVKDLITFAKARPGQLNYASGGIGSTPHLAGELLNRMANVNLVHVPFKGGGPALTGVMSGQVELFMGGMSAAMPPVKNGRLRGIAVTSPKRSQFMPDVPALAETLPGYDVVNWYAIFAPAGTPKQIIDRLNAEIVKAMATPEMRKRFADLATDAETSTPEQLGAYHRSEIKKWAQVVKDAGITPE
jgi:tripartite-type tricarboxylate transporter receptor subunit TctC